MESTGRLMRLLAVSLATSLTAAVAVPPAAAEDERRQVVSCDWSGCLLAYAVVDSDGDGVCDADELVAGTDPHDATSVPPLRRLVEVAGRELLPSFENGLAAFVVLPPDIAEGRLPAGTPDVLGAFPLRERGSALERLGISNELLSAHGIDPSSRGFSIGLGDVAGGEPHRRVGGIDVRLISAGEDDLVGLRLPAWTGTTAWTSSNGDLWTERRYEDGSVDREVTGSDGVTRGEHVTSDGTQTKNWLTTVSEREEGGSRVIEVVTEEYDSDLNLRSTTQTLTTTNEAGVTTKVTTRTEYERDDDGNVIGTTVTSNVTITGEDGETLAEGSQTQKCDANGQNCSSPYVNPDADDVLTVTPEMVDRTLRLLGSNITTLPGWAPPEGGTPRDPHDPSTIMLVHPELDDTAILADVPRLSGAQPESRPDLPSPGQAVDPANPGWPRP